MIKLMQWVVLEGRQTLEVIALVSGLVFTGASFRADAKERRISNLMSLASSHRDLWLYASGNPKLMRILRNDIDVSTEGVSAVEQRFVHLLITNLAVNFAALQSGVLPGISGLEKDVRNFFSLPIPKSVWKWSREFQDPKFVVFVERCLGAG